MTHLIICSCGKLFQPTAGQLRHYRYGRTLCPACKPSKGDPRWTTEYRNARTQRMAVSAKRFTNGRPGCERCGKQPRRLECHHRNGDKYDHRIENLEMLCVPCHRVSTNLQLQGRLHKVDRQRSTRADRSDFPELRTDRKPPSKKRARSVTHPGPMRLS